MEVSLSLFHLHNFLLWRHNVALCRHYRAWCNAAEEGSANQCLCRESPWGLVKLPLMHFFSCLNTIIVCRKDGDNYLAYYPEAGFLQGVIPGNRRLPSVVWSCD